MRGSKGKQLTAALTFNEAVFAHKSMQWSWILATTISFGGKLPYSRRQHDPADIWFEDSVVLIRHPKEAVPKPLTHWGKMKILSCYIYSNWLHDNKKVIESKVMHDIDS